MMKQDAKILKRKSADDFTAGIPNKKNPNDSLVNKAYNLGYQQAALMNGIQAFQMQQMQAQQDMAMATQQLLQLQAQKAKSEAANKQAIEQLAAPMASPMGGLPPAQPIGGAGAPPLDLSGLMGGTAPQPGGAAPMPVPVMAPGAPQPPMM
jgi:hypothetical protein